MREAATAIKATTIWARRLAAWSAPARVAVPLFLLSLLAGSLSCANDVPGEAVPTQALYYPTAVTALPTTPGGNQHRYAYVLSSNFDLRYNAAWIHVVDLGEVLEQVDDTTVNPRDWLQGQVKLPSLGGRLAIDDSGTVLLGTHRGIPRVSYLEIQDSGATLHCGDPNSNHDLEPEEKRTDCDRRHLIKIPGGPDGINPEADTLLDPFALDQWTWTSATDNVVRAMAAVGYFGSPWMTLFEVTRPSDTAFADTSIPLLSLRRHVSVMAARLGGIKAHPLANGRHIVASGHLTSTVGANSRLFHIDLERLPADPSQDGGVVHVNTEFVAAQIGGLSMFDLDFNSDGTTALGYVMNQAPNAVLVVDGTLQSFDDGNAGSDGGRANPRPGLNVLGAEIVDERPAGMVVVNREAPSKKLVAATSLLRDTLSIMTIEGTDLYHTARIDTVGQGPLSVTHARAQRNDGQGPVRDLLLVTSFFDHALHIIDVTGDEPSQFRRIAEIRDTSLPVGER